MIARVQALAGLQLREDEVEIEVVVRVGRVRGVERLTAEEIVVPELELVAESDLLATSPVRQFLATEEIPHLDPAFVQIDIGETRRVGRRIPVVEQSVCLEREVRRHVTIEVELESD